MEKVKINVWPQKLKLYLIDRWEKMLADLKLMELNLVEANWSANGFQS